MIGCQQTKKKLKKQKQIQIPVSVTIKDVLELKKKSFRNQ